MMKGDPKLNNTVSDTYRELLKTYLVAIFKLAIVVGELLDSIICKMNIYFVKILLPQVIVIAAGPYITFLEQITL